MRSSTPPRRLKSGQLEVFHAANVTGTERVLQRTTVLLNGQEVTVADAKARKEIQVWAIQGGLWAGCTSGSTPTGTRPRSSW
jgi:hypothetical protein